MPVPAAWIMGMSLGAVADRDHRVCHIDAHSTAQSSSWMSLDSLVTMSAVTYR